MTEPSDGIGAEGTRQTPARGRGRGRKGGAATRKPAVAATLLPEEPPNLEPRVKPEVPRPSLN